MSQSQSNVQRLEDAGILKAAHFSEQDTKLIESITSEEVEVLIKLRAKLGETPAGKEHMRPNIIV